MPPKKRASTKKSKSKSKATVKESAENLNSPAIVQRNVRSTGATCEQGSPSSQLLSTGKKRAADSPEHDVVSTNKKAKVAVAEEVADDDPESGGEPVTGEESWSLLSDEDYDKLRKLRDKLSYHVPTTMRYIFKGIDYEKDILDNAPLTELIETLIDELKRRILTGKEIASELEVINDVDNKWHDGEYDDEVDDDDDFPKDVQKRLNHAESMLQFMAGGALKSIMRQLNPYARGAGTNKGMASMIVATLENLAKDGRDIKQEYMIVKSFGSSGCGDDSDPDLNFNSEGDESDY